jgi:hypothetical protein
MTCCLKRLKIICVLILINSLCTKVCSSLFQIGSIPYAMHIVWHVVSDGTIRFNEHAQHLPVCIPAERLNSSACT